MDHADVLIGNVFHNRPKSTKLRYRVFMVLIDLVRAEEGESAESGSSLRRWWNPIRWFTSWSRHDHFDLGVRDQTLSSCVRDLVNRNVGIATDDVGKIYLLTNPRYFGLSFNPVSVFYVYHRADDRLIAVVLEVSNTPWLEKRLYVLPFVDKVDRTSGGSDQDKMWRYSYRWKKDFHVSPFMDMYHDYCWSLNDPISDNEIHVRAVSYKRDQQPDVVKYDQSAHHTTGDAPTIPSKGNPGKDTITFVAGLHLKRESLQSWSAIRCILRQPFMTWTILLWIHVHAFRAWINGKPYIEPPKNVRQLGLLDAARHIIVFTVAGLWSHVVPLLLLLWILLSAYHFVVPI